MLITDKIIEDGFGSVGSKIIRRFTLTNANGASVRLITWGAGIQSIRVPNKKGILGDVILGWDNINGYLDDRYIGRMIGFSRLYDINTINNSEKNSLSVDDKISFDNVNWDSHVLDNQVIMSHLSKRGNRKCPEDILTQIKYTWDDDNELGVNVRATTTAPIQIDITNYCLMNLAGHGMGAKELQTHVVTINSDKCIHNWSRKQRISKYSRRSVNQTIFDLRQATMLTEKQLRLIPGGGYNHYFCINSPSIPCYRFHARVLHPESGRFVELYSNKSGMKFYTGHNLTVNKVNSSKMSSANPYHDDELKIRGKGGVLYGKYSGFSLTPQNYSNELKNTADILYPGKMYCHDFAMKFGVK